MFYIQLVGWCIDAIYLTYFFSSVFSLTMEVIWAMVVMQAGGLLAVLLMMKTGTKEYTVPICAMNSDMVF